MWIWHFVIHKRPFHLPWDLIITSETKALLGWQTSLGIWGRLDAYGSRKPKAKMSTGPLCYLTTLMGKLRSILSGTVTRKMIRELSLRLRSVLSAFIHILFDFKSLSFSLPHAVIRKIGVIRPSLLSLLACQEDWEQPRRKIRTSMSPRDLHGLHVTQPGVQALILPRTASSLHPSLKPQANRWSTVFMPLDGWGLIPWTQSSEHSGSEQAG